MTLVSYSIVAFLVCVACGIKIGLDEAGGEYATFILIAGLALVLGIAWPVALPVFVLGAVLKLIVRLIVGKQY